MKKELWRIVTEAETSRPYVEGGINVEYYWGTEEDAFNYYNTFPDYGSGFVVKEDLNKIIKMLTNLNGDSKSGVINL